MLPRPARYPSAQSSKLKNELCQFIPCQFGTHVYVLNHSSSPRKDNEITVLSAMIVYFTLQKNSLTSSLGKKREVLEAC